MSINPYQPLPIYGSIVSKWSVLSIYLSFLLLSFLSVLLSLTRSHALFFHDHVHVQILCSYVGKAMNKNPPHIYAIAEYVYTSMMDGLSKEKEGERGGGERKRI